MASSDLEFETVSYESESGIVNAYLVRPAFSASGEAQRWPAIVVIHEIFGLNDHIRDVTNRFASQGYVALAPDLFSRQDLIQVLTKKNIALTMDFIRTLPTGSARDYNFVQQQLAKIEEEGKRTAVQKTMGLLFSGLPKESLVKDLVHAVDFLNSQRYVKRGKVGCVGFCFGGGMSIALACQGKTSACVVFYGENPSPIELVEKINGPVMGLYGGEDERINSNLDKLVKVMVQYKKDFEMKIYPGCPHAFFNDTNERTYREKAAKDAWQRVLKFYKEALL